MRTYHGVCFGEQAHLERLLRSAERVMIPMPCVLETLREEVHATLAAAQNDESYVRVVVTRGAGPINLDVAAAENPARVIIVLPLRPQPPELYTAGVEV